MILDPKIIIILAIFLSNLLHFISQKSRVIACFNVIFTIFLLILFLSFSATNQALFKSASVALILFLTACVFVIMSQDESVKSKKNVKKNSFSFGYFLLIAIAVIGIFISVSYLLTIESNRPKDNNKLETIDKIDVNNTKLAKKKYKSKTSLFDERDLAIKLFKGFSDLVIFICCALPVMLCVFASKSSSGSLKN